jgi:DNA-binding NtrC family response regulator
MSLFSPSDRCLAEKLSRLILSNPFLPEWVDRERDILGDRYTEAPPAYNRQPRWIGDLLHPNIVAIISLVDKLIERAQMALRRGATIDPVELAHYEDLACYHLYKQHAEELDRLIELHVSGESIPSAEQLWADYLPSFERVFPSDREFPSGHTPEHALACFFQDRRAFYHIYRDILGSSPAAARLRGAVWQSIFTHDLRQHARRLYRRMNDIPTLIIGPSGTGKELVARAIGLSGHIPFDVKKTRFRFDFATSFLPLNLSALAPTLIESELFGHRKGAFTGAIEDREGWLEKCGPHGAVFLDEIGEVDPTIQVKLLRVLQQRKFQWIGDTETRDFKGKIIAATNRDLDAEMQAGRFRKDFYYRLCADRIRTPSLREQLQDAPGDLNDLVLFIARDLVAEDAEEVTDEIVTWIEEHLGMEYEWQGNFRELEQCVRSYILRREYHPPNKAEPGDDLPALVAAGALAKDELLRRYFMLVYRQTGNYQEAARRLKVDWRTLRAKVEKE